MAKTATSVPITQGSGANMAVHTIGTKRRQSVIIGDADSSSGENLLVELPANNTADRGSPLKIGGRARMDGPAVMLTSDESRTDAWFTLNGQLTVVNTLESNFVYDTTNGRVSLGHNQTTCNLNGAATQIVVAAITSLKIKVLRVSLVVSSWVVSSYLALTNGVGGAELLSIATFPSATGTLFVTHDLGGLELCTTSAATALVLTQTAAAGANVFRCHVTYSAGT